MGSALDSTTPQIIAPPGIKISAAYGRIYVSGPGFRTAYRLPGAAINDRRKWIELSLTLETLRGLRKLMGVSPQMFARYCTPEVLAWAKAAGKSERLVNQLHTKLATGWRMDFPWTDNAGGRDGKYRPPFDHQKVMATVACSLEGSAFLCDMGCVDADTEYLAPDGWHRISEYRGGYVAEYRPDIGSIRFVEPIEYVKLPCAEMIHFQSECGVDQMLSPEHRMLLVNRHTLGYKETRAEELEANLLADRNAMRDWRLPTTFKWDNNKNGISLSDAEIRLQVAVMADGHFPSDVSTGTRCTVRLKKERKIQRLRQLLVEAGVEAYEREAKPDGFVAFSFSAPLRTKLYDAYWWKANDHQRRIIADECTHWDGTFRKAEAVEFFSTVKTNADFIQFCFASTGRSASLSFSSDLYTVHASADRNLKQLNPQNVARVSSTDGFKYCFRVHRTFLLFRRNGCIFPSGNTGKTRAGIESLRHKLETSEIDVGVVFCPRGVMGTWRREIAMWSNGFTVVPLIDISVKERANILDSYQTPGPGSKRRIFLVNYDVVYLLEKNILNLAKRMKMGLLLDEAHRIRNPQAKVCKSSLHIAAAVEWRLAMTGSPILQGAHDIWSQWYVVDLGITFGANNAQFRREFFDASPYDFHLDPKPGALEEIGKRIRKRGLRYTKADCLDLPPKVYETMEVEMSPDQKRAYKEMEAVLVARLSGQTTAQDYSSFFAFEESERDDENDERVVTAANQLAMILRLTQITSGFAPDQDGQIHDFLPNPKLDALEEIVEENIGSQQIIIWARYRHDHDEIAKRLARFQPKIIRGGTSTADREDIELGFQEGRYRLLIGQPAAGGVGLNLYAASLAIYYSQGYSLEQRMQSEDRCHRSGSEIHNRVTYIDLVAKGTVDEVIVDALAGKKDVAAVVVDLKRAIGMAA